MDLHEYRAFVRAVEDGSFAAAARGLGSSKSVVSRQVARLEDRLGARLLNRTSRVLTTTEAGAAFFARAKEVLDSVDIAESTVAELSSEPRGSLRVSLPTTFGVRHIAPLLPDFLRAHPAIELDADFTDRKVDIVAEGFDVVVRIGVLTDSSLIARRLATSKLLTCASPEYLAARGTPERPSDLSDHTCLLYRYSAASHSQMWRFAADSGDEVSVRVAGPLLASTGEALRIAALAGLGIARLPDFMASEDVEAGRLIPLLGEWARWDGGVWVVFPHSRHVSPKVRAFVDFLGPRLRGSLRAV